MRSSLLLAALLVTAPCVAHADTLTDTLTLKYTLLSGEQQVSFSFADGNVQSLYDTTLTGTTDSNSTVGPGFPITFEFSNPPTFQVTNPLGTFSILLNIASSDLFTGVPLDPSDPDGLGTLYFKPGYHYLGDSIATDQLSTGAVNFNVQDVSLDVTQMGSAVAVTPEPSTLALLGTGLLGLCNVSRRRSQGAAA